MGEVVAFLEGYYSGSSKGLGVSDEAEKWFAFGNWLAEKLGTDKSRSVFLEVERNFAEKPIEELLGLYKSFRHEVGR